MEIDANRLSASAAICSPWFRIEVVDIRMFFEFNMAMGIAEEKTGRRMGMKMLHTCYRVKDLEASLKFYTEALGFVQKRRRDFAEHKFTLVYLGFEGDESGHELELTHNHGSPGYELGNGYSHIAVGVDDLEAWHKKHEEAGYKVSAMSGLPGAPPAYYFIADPDGYEVEVIRIKKQ